MVFGERHLRHVLRSYMSYYNGTRTHLSLNKDAPCHAPPRQLDALSGTDPGRTASSIYPDLICDKDTLPGILLGSYCAHRVYRKRRDDWCSLQR